VEYDAPIHIGSNRHFDPLHDGYRALVLAEVVIASTNIGNAVKVEAIG
jgi:hypothetical protein